MDSRARSYFRSLFNLQAPLSPARFESELARRIGSPSRRRPIVNAWRAYLRASGGDLEAVRSFYQALLGHPRERLEALVYAMHLPFIEFYLREVPPLLPLEGRVLEVGAFTGGLVALLREARPELEWHALEGVAEALSLGQARTARVQWHLGWFGQALPEGLPLMDAVLLLSCLPEGYLGDLPGTLEAEAFDRQFQFAQRLRGLEGVLRPGGLLLYGHGPFLGKNAQAAAEVLCRLGFDHVELRGEGEYSLVCGRMPEVLAEVVPEVELAEPPPPPPPPAPAPLPSQEEAWGWWEAQNYAEILRRIPEGTPGELGFLRGRALWALSRYEEAERALALAGTPEAEALRVLCWAELEDPRALPRLEALASRGGRFKLALGRLYLKQNRLTEAVRQLYESGLPEAEVYLKMALERTEERIRRLCREGDWSEVSRRVEFIEDLAPELLNHSLLRMGLQATLQQGLWGRAARYAQRLYVAGESHGALGLALVGLKVRGPEALEGAPLADLKEVEPYLTDAVARAEDATALLALGMLRHREGRHAEAVRYLERAVRGLVAEPAGTAYHLLALSKRALGYPMAEVLGDHKRAHAHRAYAIPELYRLAQEALEAGEGAMAREFLGRVRDAGLEHFEAIEPVVRLVERLEGPWEAFRLLAQWLERTLEPPLEHLELAYRLSRNFSQSSEAESVRGRYLAALYNAGQALGAEGLLLAELARNPEALEVLYDLAEHYERTGAYQKAAQTWRKALETAYYWEKDLELSREILRNLIFLNPTDPEVLLYLEELKATSQALAQLDGAPDSLAGVTPEGLLREGLPRFHGEYLVVVGGHTQLRSRMVPLLEAQGLNVDWFDSDSHTAGREVIRRIQNRLARAHGLLIISSYVGHDLSEPVRLEAENLGLPVYITPGRARGATGLIRAVAEFAPQLFKQALKGG